MGDEETDAQQAPDEKQTESTGQPDPNEQTPPTDPGSGDGTGDTSGDGNGDGTGDNSGDGDDGSTYIG